MMNQLLKRCLYFLAGCVVLENFMLVSVLGAPVQPSHLVFVVAILAALVCSRFKVNRRLGGVMILLLLLPLSPLYRINDTIEFIKSYIILVLDIAFICIAVPRFIIVLSDDRVYKKFLNTIIGVITAAELFGILQFVINNTTGKDIAYGIFGPFEGHICLTSYKWGVYRAYSIFHEPSVFAWICSFGLAVLLYKGNKITQNRALKFCYYAINAIAMLTTLSTIGYVTYVLLIFCALVVDRKVSIKKIIIGFGALFVIFLVLRYTSAINVVSRISTELSVEDSSGYERTVVPLEYMKRTFEYYPIFGRGLGQTGNIDKVGIIGLTAGVNNSIMGIFVDFGLSAIIPISFFICAMIKSIRRNKRSLVIVLNMLIIFFSTGAYMAIAVVVVQICGYLLCFEQCGLEKK